MKLPQGAKLALMVLGAVCLLPGALLAAHDYKMDTGPGVIELTQSETGEKLSRGMTNMAFGWTELIRTPVSIGDSPRYTFFQALAIGLPYGLVRAVGRTFVGVYEVATFYAPQRPIFYEITSTP